MGLNVSALLFFILTMYIFIIAFHFVTGREWDDLGTGPLVNLSAYRIAPLLVIY